MRGLNKLEQLVADVQNTHECLERAYLELETLRRAMGGAAVDGEEVDYAAVKTTVTSVCDRLRPLAGHEEPK